MALLYLVPRYGGKWARRFKGEPKKSWMPAFAGISGEV